jgi:hypothetical protein
MLERAEKENLFFHLHGRRYEVRVNHEDAGVYRWVHGGCMGCMGCMGEMGEVGMAYN